MPSMRGQPADQGTANDDFYHTSKATAYPVYHGPVAPKAAGQSKYASEEIKQYREPFANVGKMNFDLFDPTGREKAAREQAQYEASGLPKPPGAAEVMKFIQAPWMNADKGESLAGVPGAGLIGGGIDFLSHLAAPLTDEKDHPAGVFSQQLFNRLKGTPDEQLTETERQVKNLNAGLFSQPPDSPLMQGKQIGEMYKQYLNAEAHARGSSSQIVASTIGDGVDFSSPLGVPLQGYALLSGMLRRALGSMPFNDQLGAIKTGTPETLGPERQKIREQLDRGEINDEEARDLTALSSFALSNPNPVGTGIGPVDAVANAAIALGGELISDPLTYATLGTGTIAKTGLSSVGMTLRSIERAIGESAVEAGAKAAGEVTAKYAAGAAGTEVRRQAILQATTATEEAAARSLSGQALIRHLPKEATMAAKAGQAVPKEAVTQADRLAAFLDMGAQPGPYGDAIKAGIENAGLAGHIAVKMPTVVKVGQAVDKVTDPLSLFGYWRTGRTVPIAMSKMAAHGFTDAVGWRVTRRLDSALEAAGASRERVQAARGTAAANHTIQAADRSNQARAVANNSAIIGPETPTEMAARHATRRDGDIRRLVRDQVDRTMEYIMPASKGGAAEATARWRERAVRQMVDFGADEASARQVASTMEEREMRGLANDHWGLMIDTLDAAKRGAKETAKWPAQALQRITFMGPRQIAQQDATALREAITRGDIGAVRDAVRRYSDLGHVVNESLSDAETMAEVGRVLDQIDGTLPVKIEDMTDMPPELAEFARAHPDYPLMMSPDANSLVTPIRDKTGKITGVKTWLDHYTERTPIQETGRFKALREDAFRGIAGGELERNAQRRFAFNMAERTGLTEAESGSVWRAINDMAETTETGARGLSAEQIIRATENAKALSPERRMLAMRVVRDAMFDAYENEMRLVGVMPKLTGWVKKNALEVPGGGGVAWMSDFLYPLLRFKKSPLFFLQEVPEAPFFMALMGRYPMSAMVPDVAAQALENVPIVGGVGRAIRESKENVRLWNDRTMVVMDRLTRTGANAEYDQYEIAEMVRMGLTAASDMTDPRTRLGKLLNKQWKDLNGRKAQSVALATRREFGEQWKRSLMKNAPEQWRAVRAFYPDEMSDGEVSVAWALDMMTRADPDSIYTRLSPSSFQPSHIGARAEVSDELLRYFAYGEEPAKAKTWTDLVSDVKSGTVSMDALRRDMADAGADHDYIERATQRLEFGTADEFYRAANDLGISTDTTDAWRASNRVKAALQGITEEEYLTRNYVGRPLSVDQMGNVVGDTLFDDIVVSMKARGKAIPDSDHPDVEALKVAANDMITGVLRPVPTPGGEVVPIPARMPKGTPEDVRKAANKVRGWETVRAQRAADPTLHQPPTIGVKNKGEPVPGYDLHYEDDPFLNYYEREGLRFSEASFGSTNAGRSVQVTGPDGKVIGFVWASLDPETNTLHVAQSQVLDPHGRKGIGNWMYRQLEEQTGATIMPSREQSPTARALWAQSDRPFGPQERTMREYQSGIGTGTVRPVGAERAVDPATLPSFNDIPEEYWPPDVDTFNDPTLVKMDPIHMTPDGKFISRDDRARVQAARQQGAQVRVQTMDFVKGPRPLYQSDLHTIGPTTPEQYRRQIETMMDPVKMQKRGMRAMTEKEALLAIDWYDHMRRATFALVDDNLTGDERIMAAARILVSFGTTQLNTSPADGYRHVFKAYGMKARGEELQLGEARNILQQAVGLNPEQLHALVWNDQSKISQMGIAQKLFDFIDSLTGSKTRTNGITGPRGDWGPVAVDIHTKRDFGYLDPAMGGWVYHLVEKQGPSGELVHGVSSKFVKEGGAPGAEFGHFVIEMSDGTTEVIPKEHIGAGVPTDGEYDFGVELGNDIRDHFNETNFMGRQWSSYEVQAIGWYRMQLLKSSEGDAGEVANAVFEQSRWMGSNDLTPSPDAPMNELYPWDDVRPEHAADIQIRGSHFASDEAEMATGVQVLTKTDYGAVHGGTHRHATTVEALSDPSGIEQYLAHYGLLSEQDSVTMMRDYVGKPKPPKYHGKGSGRGVGISVDIPVRDQAHGEELLQRLAAEEGSPLQAIGSRSYIAPASDGSLHIRTLWEPGDTKADRNAFNKALKASGLAEALGEGETYQTRSVDYITVANDWKARPDGGGFMDVLERGSHQHPVSRTPEDRAALVAEYDARYQAALATGDAKAIKAAKKEMEVARATPTGRPTATVRELVRESRLRTRTELTSDFDRRAAREVRHHRERILGESRDANAESLGTDPLVSTVLDGATASNGARLYERTPGGTVRAAVTRSGSAERRSQLYFNRAAVTPRSLLHEIVHKDAWEFDDSANRVIAGMFNGLEGTPYGTWVPGTPLTEPQHEWLVNQFFQWAEKPDTVHPTLQPLLKHLAGKLGSEKTLRTEATAPSRAAIKTLDTEFTTLTARRAAAKTNRTRKTIDALIAENRAKRDAASQLGGALRAEGGLSPEVKEVLDRIAASAGARSETKASTFNRDEQDMLEWAQISMNSAHRRANDLVHMRGERSAFERSINHPFLAMYPTSYMYGKVLPYLAEFLMFRPFGAKAPLTALAVGHHMNESFNRQQQYDPELRNYLYKNEPFLRAMSMFVPGLPWDLSSGTAYWQRKVISNWLDNATRRMQGKKEVPLDIPDLIANSAMYNLTVRGPGSFDQILNAVNPLTDQGLNVPPGIEALGTMATGKVPEKTLQPPQP